jgi:hypothetical protein
MKQDTLFHADDSGIAVKGIGSGELICITPTNDNLRITVNDVMCVPLVQDGLLSVSYLTQREFRVTFENEACIFIKGNDSWFGKSRRKT